MRKNYIFNQSFSTPFQNTILLKPTLRKITAFLVLLCSLTTTAQTVHISPTGDGGFETGTTLVANSWLTNQSTAVGRNFWVCNTAPTGYTGTRCAYVTNDGAPAIPPNTYNMSPARSFVIYKDVNVPAGEDIISLNFKWKCVGESVNDRMRIWIVPTTYVPAIGTQVTATPGRFNIGTLTGGLTDYSGSATWVTSPQITLPATYAGTSFRLMIEWRNDATVTAATAPAAIDDISVTSQGFNDDCITAKALNVTSACMPETFTNVGATDSTTAPTPSGCGAFNPTGSYGGEDVWFKVTVPASGQLTFETSDAGGLGDTVMAIYSGTCAGTLTPLACDDDSGRDLFSLITLTGQTPGATLFIRVWDYGGNDTGTFGICVSSPSCFAPIVGTTTPIGTTTATINWAPTIVPSSGYEYAYSTVNVAPASGTSTAALTAALTGLSQNTTYYVFVRSFCGAGDYSPWASGTFTTSIAPPVTTGVAICAGGSGTISATALCSTPSNIGTTINGTFNSATDPVALRPDTAIISTDPCLFDIYTSNYTALNFTVTATGSYTFTMADTTLFDGMGYITASGFTPGTCSAGWLGGDDDGAATALEPAITVTLTAGTPYILFTTVHSFANTTANGNYTWNVTGPGTINSTQAGILQWYTVASGGTPIGTGTPFNPVGVAGSGLANTNTPGTYTYYAACSSFPNIRTAATFTIQGPTSVISGTGSACSGATTISIALTGVAPWTLTYTDGTTPVTVTTSTNPYTASVNPGIPSTYTVSALSDANCPSSLAANRTGTATITGKAWNSISTSDWSNAANWLPVGVPSNTDCVTIGVSAYPPVVTGPIYTALAGRLSLANGATLVVNAGNSLIVTDEITVGTGGNIALLDDANLIQITNVATNNNVGNNNSVTYTRIATLRNYDYIYWSSPFESLYTYQFSPTSGINYIYKWDTNATNNNGGQGKWAAGNDFGAPAVKGKGYIVRGPSGHPATPTNYTFSFSGKPNNGLVDIPALKGTISTGLTGTNGFAITAEDDNWNLLGNPYPSSIDADTFISANGVLDGFVKIWSHGTQIGPNGASFYGSAQLSYAASDYITYTPGSGSVPPGYNGKIASGQGFFVNLLESEASGEMIYFDNTMRYNTVTTPHDNTQFYRQAEEQKDRLWLNIINQNNSKLTTLIGYFEGATNEKDRIYDAFGDNESNYTIYSKIGNDAYTIQGRPPFDINDRVNIGYKAPEVGTYQIGIDTAEGIFADATQNIYLEDTSNGIIHDLRATPYSFTSQTGSFENRFVLRYTNANLGTNDNTINNTFSYIKNNYINIQSTESIALVEVYDVSGKLLSSTVLNGDSTTFREVFNYPNGVYLAKIKLSSGLVITRKVVN